MLVKIDDEVLFEIDERMIKLIAHDIEDPIPDIKRRLRWIIEHKCDRCFDRMKQEWTAEGPDGQSKLAKLGVAAIPTNKRDLADLIMSHPTYMNRVQREAFAEQERIRKEAEKALLGANDNS
jgi:hypothetical protein